ncbi:MAG: flavodoxin [Meiothermus sp.]
MTDRAVLIAYATRTGSAREIAEVLGAGLARKGVRVEVRRMEDVQGLSPYAAVVLGSAVREEMWLPEAVEFVRQNQEELRKIPLFYYVVAMTLAEDTPEHAQEVLGYLRPVRALVEPVDIGLFAGALDKGKLSPVIRLMLTKKGFPDGDWRDWEAVRAWGERVWERLRQEEVGGL